MASSAIGSAKRTRVTVVMIWASLGADETETGPKPAQRALVEGVGVYAAFGGHNQFDRTPFTFKSHAPFDVPALLVAAARGSVHADGSDAGRSDRAQVCVKRNAHLYAGIPFPGVVDVRTKQHAHRVAAHADVHVAAVEI